MIKSILLSCDQGCKLLTHVNEDEDQQETHIRLRVIHSGTISTEEEITLVEGKVHDQEDYEVEDDTEGEEDWLYIVIDVAL